MTVHGTVTGRAQHNNTTIIVITNSEGTNDGEGVSKPTQPVKHITVSQGIFHELNMLQL